MQASKDFFALEVVFALYVLLNLALVAEHYLMPSLLNISRRYGLNRDLTGIVVAVGNSVPELTTTLLSFYKHGVKMTEFGVASNVGCALFTITVVPACAILMTGRRP
jgi:Ca2+/Na+ antiporter